MSDEFMFNAWRKPPTQLARQLRERLHTVDARHAVYNRRRKAFRAVAYAATVLLAIGLGTLPSVRAGAVAFLDLFRVVNFVAVPVERERASVLQRGLDLPRMLGEQVHTLQVAGPPQPVSTPEEAGQVAGIRVRLPTWRPVGLEVQGIDVLGAQTWSVTASTKKLQSILDALAIEDLSAPVGIDGQNATIHGFPAVRVTYGSKSNQVMLVQARRAEVTLPSGTDLTLLGEMALRVLGLDRAEAHRFAQNVDWHTTLLVPVPAGIANFRRVDLQGSSGLLIETAGRESWLLWSSADSVFALGGHQRPQELFEMAESIQ
jgi:hypothetical protein